MQQQNLHICIRSAIRLVRRQLKRTVAFICIYVWSTNVHKVLISRCHFWLLPLSNSVYQLIFWASISIFQQHPEVNKIYRDAALNLNASRLKYPRMNMFNRNFETDLVEFGSWRSGHHLCHHGVTHHKAKREQRSRQLSHQRILSLQVSRDGLLRGPVAVGKGQEKEG